MRSNYEATEIVRKDIAPYIDLGYRLIDSIKTKIDSLSIVLYDKTQDIIDNNVNALEPIAQRLFQKAISSGKNVEYCIDVYNLAIDDLKLNLTKKSFDCMQVQVNASVKAFSDAESRLDIQETAAFKLIKKAMKTTTSKILLQVLNEIDSTSSNIRMESIDVIKNLHSFERILQKEAANCTLALYQEGIAIKQNILVNVKNCV